MKKKKIVSALCAASIAASSQTIPVCYAQSTPMPEIPASRSRSANGEPLYGDANCDGEVDKADYDFLKAYLFAENPDMTDEGKRNADIYDPGIVLDETDLDYLNNYINSRGELPIYANIKKPLYGDVNCDGKVDKVDYADLSDFLNDQDADITKQGMVNADVHIPGTGLDVKDRDALDGFLKGEYDLPLWNGFDGNQTQTTTEPSSTTTAATTEAQTVTTTAVNTSVSNQFLYGDSNCDGVVDDNDVTFLNTYLNGDHSKMTSLGLRNSDVLDPGIKITAADSETIIKYIKGIVTLPVYNEISVPLYGDVDCNGVVDDKDIELLGSYIRNEDVTLSNQAKVNADVHEPNGGINVKDIAAIQDFLDGTIDLPLWNGYDGSQDITTGTEPESTTSNAATTDDETITTTTVTLSKFLYGDVNCDDKVDSTDVDLLKSYFDGKNVKISEQGMLNADVYNNGSGVDQKDYAALNQYVIGKGDIPVFDPFSVTIYGDINCDGKLDIKDDVLFANYLEDEESAVVSDQGKINGDIHNHGSGLNKRDSDLMLKAIVGNIEVPVIDSFYVT